MIEIKRELQEEKKKYKEKVFVYQGAKKQFNRIQSNTKHYITIR